MRTPVACLSLALLASCQATDDGPSPVSPQSHGGKTTFSSGLFTYKYHVDDLSNGLRLVTIPTDFPDLVTLHLIVGTGSRNEIEPGRSGFAHFFEHMMFRGSKNFSQAEQKKIFKAIGADRNAYTTDDYTNYHTTCDKADLETVVKLEADRFRHLQYTRKDFRTESQAVFGEYNKGSSNPISKIFEVVRDTAYQQHTYKHTTLGFLRDIVKMPRQYDYSLDFFARWYKPEYVTIMAVGDLDHEQTLALTKKYFGDWQRGSHVAKIPEEPAQKAPLECHIKWRSETQPWLAVAFHGPAFSPGDKGMPSLDVLASIGFSPSSELYKQLYVRERKVTTLFSYFPDHRDPYLLMVLARVPNVADLGYVRDKILSTCKSLQTQSVSNAQLEQVKSNLKYSFASGLDSTTGIADSLAGYIAGSRTPAAINTLFRTYDSITATDVQAVARRYFRPENRTVCTLLYGDKPDLGEIELSMMHLGPIGGAAARAKHFSGAFAIDSAAADPKPAMLIPSSSPLVSFRILFGTGAMYDPKGKEGLANITAQMLSNAGTGKRSYEDIVAAMFPMSAGFSAQVDKQMTVFAGTVHIDNLVPYYRFVHEMLTDPGFEQADLDRIKINTVSYIDAGLRRADDEETGKEVLYGEIYADHPFGHFNSGTIEAVESITLEDVRAFYKAQFRAPFLGMSGGYPKGFPARVAADLEAAFGEARDVAELRGEEIGEVTEITKNRLTIVEKAATATGIHVGFPIDVTRSHPDWPALWLVRSFFGEHRSDNSYLYQRLRAIRGLNYGDYAYIEYFPGGGGTMQPPPNVARSSQIFQIWIRPVPHANGPFTFKAMQYELAKFVEAGMSEADFAATRLFLSKYVKTLVASQDRQLGYAIDSRFYGTPEFTQLVQDGLRKLTLADVNRVIRNYLRADRLQYVVVTDDADKFKERILGAAITPIVYVSKPDAKILAEDKLIEALKISLTPSQIRVLPIEEVFRRRP